MQKLAHKTRVSTHPDQETITAALSLQAVKTLFKAGLGCITWIRCLLSEDNFETTYLTSLPIFGKPESSGPQTSSGSRITTIKRGFSTEAERLLDYLEKGIFDALEKQYLKSFVFAIYLDEKDPKNLVEAYTFNVSYHKIDGTDIQVPALTLETSISKLNLEQLDSSAAVTKSNRPPTLGEVKKSVRVLIKGIVSMSQTLDELPDHRFATFKIYYNDHTPSEYEPPHFVAGDAEKDRFFFSTHSVREAPERSLCGESNTGGHSVRVDVTSIVDRLPHESNSATFTGHTNVNDSNQTFRQVEAKRKADIKIQLDDAKNRQVVWDAELADEEVPFGVRQEGEIVPIPWKGKGKDSPIRHRGGQHHVPGLDDAGASSSAPAGEATQLLETQATFVVPPSDISPTQEYENTQRDAVMDEAQGSAGTSDSTKPTEVQSQGPSAQDEAMADIRIHPAIDPAILRWKSVDCYCGIDDDTSETFVCQGACARRLHTWCMAFNTAEEVASAEDSTCVECTLRADPVYGLMSDKNRQRFSRDLAILAIYRRTIKLVYEHGYPGNPTALHKLVGCTRPDAVNNTKRMEDEGFLEARITEFDPLGLIASSVPAKSVKNAKKKANKKAAKPQLVVVKTAAVKRQFERYFEPQGEIMTDLLKSYRPTKDKAPNAPPAQDTPAGNVLVPSSSINIPSQDPVTPTRTSTQQAESQTQQETQMFVEPVTPTLRKLSGSKRRMSTRLSENQAKKMKISLAKDGVELDTYE